jgi:isoquinoline 1-oxidoreductase
MNEWPADLLSEPERYELREGLEAWEMTRRQFFQFAGSGIVVGLLLTQDGEAQPPVGRQRGGREPLPKEIGAWLHIGEDSIATAYTGKVEIGQNIRTSLTQAVAEELRLPVSRVRLVMADTALVPFDGGTAGSQTTPMMSSQLRRVAAAARELLLNLAAKEGKIERGTLTVTDGRVVGPGGRPSFEFGQLTKGQKLVQLVEEKPPTTDPVNWTVAGTPVAKVDGPAFVTGAHQYASDIRRPGMVFGKVLRPPSFKAELQRVEPRSAETPPGVNVVRDGTFVGVTAPTEQAAIDALANLNAKWKTTPQPSNDGLWEQLKTHPASVQGFGRSSKFKQGSVQEGLSAADTKLEAAYTVAYIAHCPLEPRAAVAEWSDGKLTVWTGTQRPFGVRGELSNALGIPVAQVRVIVPDMGAGYGGKHTGEAAVEAARLARSVGKPVKVVWTREEEFTWAYFRPAGLIEIKAGAARDGTLTAWECHNYNSGGSSIRTPYEIPHQHTEFHAAESPLRQGSYRALAATANVFARESLMDDLAYALQMDPLGFRLKNLKNLRLRTVLEAAAQRFGWGKDKPAAGQGVGLATGTEKGSYVASCAEVAVDPRKGVQVVRVVTAFECGAVVNPDHLKNQVEGAVMMGLGGALFEEIKFADGKIINPRFSDYRVPRFRDVPVLETVLVNRKDLPSAGAGETPIVAVAPAVGNAIFQASRKRIRSLPMVPNGLQAK